jgi:hypothetical protein
MHGKQFISGFVVGAAIFLGGWLITQSSHGQPKDEKPAGPSGRYQAVALTGGDFGVLDTATGRTWKYAANIGGWGDLGIPAEETKRK